MALKKIIDYKGKDAEYWKVTKITADHIAKKTFIEIRVYWNEISRNENVQNFLNIRRIIEVDLIDLKRDDAYVEIKKSKKVKKQVTVDNIPQVDENNIPIMEEIETNWFIDAEDC